MVYTLTASGEDFKLVFNQLALENDKQHSLFHIFLESVTETNQSY